MSCGDLSPACLNMQNACARDAHVKYPVRAQTLTPADVKVNLSSPESLIK